MNPPSGPGPDGSLGTTPHGSQQRPEPLSFAQEQLWFLDQLAPGETIYNIAIAYRLRGPLEVDILRRCLALIVDRHEALRATFGSVDGSPFQVVTPASEVGLSVTDLTGSQDPQAALHSAVQTETTTPFDLEHGPLYRFRLFRLGVDQHVLCLGFHHIVTDGWSAGVINRELSAAYRAMLDGREPELPQPELRYAEHVRVQRDELRGAALEEELQFWERQLAGLPVLELPSDRLRPVLPSYLGNSLVVGLPADLLPDLRSFAQQHGASLFMVLTAAVNVVLSRYTNQEDVPVGVTMLGRANPDLEDVVGLFVNMAVLRTDLSGDPSFADLLDRIAEANLDIYDHQEVPFEKVVERVQPVRDPSRNPLFQVAVQVLGDDTSGGSLALPGISVETLPVTSRRSRFDLAINFVESADRLQVTVEYSTDLFDRWRIEAMIGHFQHVLTAVTKDPSLRLSEIPLLSDAERERLLAAGRGEQVSYPDEPVHVGVAAIAAASPAAVAAVCRGTELTYRELDRRADRLARYLRSRGLRHEQVVAIALDRDLDALVAMLGVLKAGGAYTMMDPSHPVSRLEYMLQDTAAPLVLTRSAFVGDLPEPSGWSPSGWSVVPLDTEWDAIESVPAEEPLVEWATRDSLAYVLYTSGSTGKPKGVLIEHRALTCFVEAYKRTFDFGPADRLLQLPALTFDMSQGEIYTALAVGATLVLVAQEEGLAPDALTRLMRDQQVTYAGLSPAMLSLLEAEPYPHLRCVMGGADALPAELVNKWNLPGRRFVNLYGPTEAAVACTEYECEHIEWQSSPPIGHPELNRLAYVVDRFENLAPTGVPGELLIGGDEGLARGYLNQPELTAEKFVPDPFRPDGLVYRSGDLVRWTQAGEIEFLGRLDSQVKLRGLRIELGEIESALLTHPQIRMATVLMRADSGGEKQLVAYFTTKGERRPAVPDLRRHLGEQLPEYMVPTAWVALEEFPLTAARKIDRAALPAPDEAGGDDERELLAPRTPTEARIAEIFSEVLGRPQVGADENLFELGGNSLQAMRVVSRINKAFRVKVNIRLLYGTSTVSAISKTIDDLVAQKAGHAQPEQAVEVSRDR